ncbi:hypothetical protein [Falsiroseomonas stagni]|uniref:Uncharacterized protein n=1 Tax=Falsiroseomonas stagni DSM 19981 TaxID=1123062 RepID=A0A1I3Y474_9PROT|nr:hypothetical protein [Falsiroseomonas stagni]SFK26658.1 hypothetical protein SAMN02745775_101955 [Falsiroseomonas stagni DSM 19981]
MAHPGFRSVVAKGVAVLALPAMLAACGGSESTSNVLTAGQAPCPRITILADGADLTQYVAGAPRDLTTMVLDARIAGFDAVCDYASRDRRALDVRVTPRFQVERGPAARGGSLDMPWFIAVSDAGDTDVIERQAFTARATLASNQTRVNSTGQAARLRLPIGEGVSAGNYLVRISFQLTPDQLAQNRSRGPR